jgi:hypothetical protein
MIESFEPLQAPIDLHLVDRKSIHIGVPGPPRLRDVVAAERAVLGRSSSMMLRAATFTDDNTASSFDFLSERD